MNKLMFRYFSLLLLAFLMVCLGTNAEPIYTDGVVAIVGGEPILQSDIMQEILPKLQENGTAAMSDAGEDPMEPLFKEALEQAIEHFILYKEAKKAGVEISDADVEKQITEIRKQYDSTESFQKALDAAGFTVRDFRERMRRQMMAMSVGMAKRREFEKEAVVSENDLRQYYEESAAKYEFPAQYRVRRIFLSSGGGTGDKDALRERLASLRAEIEGGADFEELARKNSQGPEANEGGMMGWTKPEDLVEPLGSAIQALQPGQMSEVLETEFGVHLLRVEEFQEAGSKPFNEVRTELEPLVRNKIAGLRYRQWMGTLRKRNNVKLLI
ncbi:MAG: hypothetical protein GX117_06920 [Candidatus Hydrogenedentes bacterium]|nr:hypothetical protein [Candidatus Hydrogenedentota bacterium]